MRVLSVEFAGAIGSPGGPPPEPRLQAVAFAGRSNVGKSSLINRLLGRTRSQLAHVSGSPGKTRTINFYRVRAERSNEDRFEFMLVDLPGYGFAKVPLHVRESWRPLVDAYLRDSSELAGVVQLVDARHDPTREDKLMVEYLGEIGVPVLIAATKFDKVRPAARHSSVENMASQLGVPPEQIVPCSSRTGEGRTELLECIETLLLESG